MDMFLLQCLSGCTSVTLCLEIRAQFTCYRHENLMKKTTAEFKNIKSAVLITLHLSKACPIYSNSKVSVYIILALFPTPYPAFRHSQYSYIAEQTGTTGKAVSTLATLGQS